MSITTKEEARKRTYGYSFNSHRYDESKCVESVYPSERGYMPHQCRRKPGHGPEGLYCKQHDPIAAAAKYAKETAERKARADAADAEETVVRALRRRLHVGTLVGGGFIRLTADDARTLLAELGR